MSNKQQTAVEWLQSIELKRDLTLADWAQAKEMEKEKAIKLYIDYENYLHEEFKHQNGGQAVILSFREFYKETYGGNK
jgi:type IV secretory pathway VirJ component